jgi:predicted phage terminase large subunit-like protein
MLSTPAAEQASIEAARLELRLLQLEAQEKSQMDFMSFAKYMWPDGIFGAHHEKMADAFNRLADGTLKRLIINMPPRHRLTLNTPIPTTKGWKTVESVVNGDVVFSPDGSPVVVTGKSAVFEERLYEVTTSDGQTIECDGEHLWTVRFGSNRPYQTLSTIEILHKLETEGWRALGNRPILPRQSAAQYPEAELLVDPYILGVWLGDGSSYGASIGCSFADMPQMRAQVEACGYSTTYNPNFQQFNVLGLHSQLRELGVLKNKHIPETYLCASVSQRMALLQGLIDTDGDVTKDGKVTFNQTNLAIIEQVLCLIHSLGVKARITTRQTNYKGIPSQPSHRIMFKLANAARIPRKADRCRPLKGNWSRSIDIKRTSRTGLVQCLEVDNADGLFMAGRGWVVTHNTKSEFSSYLLPAFIMGRKPKTKIIQATHTGELAVRFGRKVRNLMDSEEYKQVFSNVALRADSKAAGRWDTDHGGEYFACLRPYALVRTVRGPLSADRIKEGDVLLNCGKSVTVQKIYHSKHSETFNIAGLDCSASHPIWTMNRGWVYAAHVNSTDVLCVESILNRIKAYLRRAYGYLEHAFVPAMVQHEVSLFKPQEREVEQLWGTRHYGIRALASLREFLRRHGRATVSSAYDWANRQRWALQPGQLSLGDAYSTVQQSTRQCNNRWEDVSANSKRAGHHPRSGSVSFEEGTQSIRRAEVQEEELSMYGAPKGLGWIRCAAAQLLVRGIKTFSKTGCGLKGDMAGLGKTTQDLCGLLLGVRLAGHVSRTTHQGEGFINFLTDGDHTFFAEGVLTHNCGVGGAMTGRGADLLIIDDPHSEQDALSELAMENAWEWYTSGPRQRLQPGGAVVVVMTRWNTKDLTAKLIKAQKSHNADRWEVIEFPAILPSGNPLWPTFWKLEELLAVKASLSPQKWQAQWQQQPTNDEGAILKRDWWKVWPSDEPPEVEYVMQSYDTAYSKKETADFSAITTWGVFYPDVDSGPNIILLDVTKGRWDFPELKRIAKEQYDLWKPDNVLIEAKATGITLQQELRRVGIPVTMYSPGGRRSGQDKVSRAHSVAPMLESGMVWAPDTDWAEELVEECAAFPKGDNDDLVDSFVQAMMRFRAGNFISLGTDLMEDDKQQDVAFEYY